ncbi:MAG: small multi-drug export protein [Bradymonadaceae bacterium]|nr:small multi-drug export protein [Lujinxingiaceae bacterium]
MTEYLAKALATWLIAFFPLAEIYVAVPSAMAMGLDPLSAVAWSVFGNYVPVFVVYVAYSQILRIPRFGPWLERRASATVRDRLDRHGFWFVVLITPWIGVWIVALVVRLFGMDARRFFLSSFISIALYAIVIAAAISLGLEALGGASG